MRRYLLALCYKGRSFVVDMWPTLVTSSDSFFLARSLLTGSLSIYRQDHQPDAILILPIEQHLLEVFKRTVDTYPPFP